MIIEQVSDWGLEDRLLVRGRPLVALFVQSDEILLAELRAELRQLAREHPGARFCEVDLLENPSLRLAYDIPFTPTVLVFVDGVEVARHAGTRIAGTVERLLSGKEGRDV